MYDSDAYFMKKHFIGVRLVIGILVMYIIFKRISYYRSL